MGRSGGTTAGDEGGATAQHGEGGRTDRDRAGRAPVAVVGVAGRRRQSRAGRSRRPWRGRFRRRSRRGGRLGRHCDGGGDRARREPRRWSVPLSSSLSRSGCRRRPRPPAGPARRVEGDIVDRRRRLGTRREHQHSWRRYSSAGSPLITPAPRRSRRPGWQETSSTPGVSGAVNSTERRPPRRQAARCRSTRAPCCHHRRAWPWRSNRRRGRRWRRGTAPGCDGDGRRLAAAVGRLQVDDDAPAGTATTSGSVWASTDPGTATARATAATARIRFIRPFSLRRAAEASRREGVMIFEQYYLECLSQASYLIGDTSTRTGSRRRPSPRTSHDPRVGRRARPHDRAGDRDPLPRRFPLRSPRAGGGDRGDDRLWLRRRDRVRVAKLVDGERVESARWSWRCATRLGTPPSRSASSCGSVQRTPSRSPCSPVTRCSSATSAGPTCCRRRASPATSWLASCSTRCTVTARHSLTARRYPAHGAGSACGKNLSTDTWSTIGEQRRTNYASAPMTKSAFIEAVTDGQSAPPAYFSYDAERNRGATPARRGRGPTIADTGRGDPPAALGRGGAGHP